MNLLWSTYFTILSHTHIPVRQFPHQYTTEHIGKADVSILTKLSGGCFLILEMTVKGIEFPNLKWNKGIQEYEEARWPLSFSDKVRTITKITHKDEIIIRTTLCDL